MTPKEEQLANGGWQPIETAPCVGKKRLLFFAASGHCITGYKRAGSKIVVPEYGGGPRLATHWMPLPSPPQDQ